MSSHGVASLYLNEDHWQLSFASTAGYRHTPQEVFADTDKGKSRLLSFLADKLKSMSTERSRVIFIRSGPVINPFYFQVYNTFPFPRVVHLNRLHLHEKRLGRTFDNPAELAAEAAVTGMYAEDMLLEVTNVCTFNCLYCTQDQITRKKERMPLEVARTIIEEYAANSIGSMAFHLMGEPTTHPDLAKIIKHAAQHHIEHALVTNASLLTRQKAEDLFESGLMHMMISVQTHTPEQHKTFKRPAPRYTHELLLENMKNIILAKWAKAPDAILQIHVMDTSVYKPRGVRVIENNTEAEEVMRFWIDFVRQLARESGNTALIEKMAPPSTLDITQGCWPHNACHIEPNITLTFKMSGHWIQNFLTDDEFVLPAQKGSCRPIANQEPCLLAIQSSGDVVLCCFDYDGGTKVGNIHQSSLAELDKRVYQWRKKLFQAERLPFKLCRRCLGLRVKILGTKQPRSDSDKEVAWEKVTVWQGTRESASIMELLKNMGINAEPIGPATPDQSHELQETPVIFPPDWPRDQSVLGDLEARFPGILLAKVDPIALDPFDRSRQKPAAPPASQANPSEPSHQQQVEEAHPKPPAGGLLGVLINKIFG